MEKRCKIEYIRDSKGIKWLPWQYYNNFGLITIPMVGKAPMIPGWNKKTKTIHPGYTGYNIGILTGEVNGITVLDIDIKDNGLEYWHNIVSQHAPVKAPTVVSPTGIHVYFKYEKGLRTTNRLKVQGHLPKIGWDVRNNNAIIVAPPSTSDIKKYKWVEGHSLNEIKISKMPKWLLNYIKKAQSI